MAYLREHHRLMQELRKRLNEKSIEALKKNNASLIGGAITSLFSDRPINDFDIYFSKDYRINYAKHTINDQLKIKYESDRAITFEEDIQLIKAFTGTDKQIFDRFDFTINMGGYSFKHERFFFHKSFFPHLAQRKLFINPKIRYPFNTLLRVNKYLKRGYTIENASLIVLGLLISRLKFETYGDLDGEIQGVSEWVTSLFENCKLDEPIDFKKTVKFLQGGEIDFDAPEKLYFDKVITSF